MRDQRKHFPVNWVDGMKINKNHFIEQDNSWADALQESVSFQLSPIRYGILPPSAAGEDTYNINIAHDNQHSLRVTVLSCEAITSGGARISIFASPKTSQQNNNTGLSEIFPFNASEKEGLWWAFISVHPFEKQPWGSPDTAEDPPRFPHVSPLYTLHVVSSNDYNQFAGHPYSLAIGKISVSGNMVRVDENYIPPCYSISANPDLISLHAELDKFSSDIEMYSSQIIQKIFRKNQQNEISELVQFLCDRVMMFLSQFIISMRWFRVNESPALMMADISTLARIMKNAIDMRIGSGKDELLTYFSEWCELKQGELESMLANLANLNYDHNDIDQGIYKVVSFVKVCTNLFSTLSKLEFIGKKKDTSIFLKEQSGPQVQTSDAAAKAKRRFFG